MDKISIKNNIIDYYNKLCFKSENHFPNRNHYTGIGWISSNIRIKYDEPTHINIIFGKEIELFINYFQFDVNEIWGKKDIKYGIGNQYYSKFYLYSENTINEINEEIKKILSFNL